MTLRKLFLAMSAALPPVIASAQSEDGNLRDLCPDRPGKNVSACTVDAGHFQLETELFDGAFDSEGGVSTDTYVFANPTLKYGLTDNWDIEANLVPYVDIHIHDRADGNSQDISGVGDLYLHSKWAVIGNGGSAFAFALDPFVKIPTAAHDIGNGAVEGGLQAPLSLSLGSGWSLAATPEADVLRNAERTGDHAALIGAVGLTYGFDNGVSLGAELWQSRDFDPAWVNQQASFDLMAAWIPGGDKNLQLDGGVNIGMTRATPEGQVYVGLSRRF